MPISILDKLARLLSKHFRVEKMIRQSDIRPQGLKVYLKHGKFSRRDWDKVTEVADRYGANVSGRGYILVSKKCSRSDQNSLNQGRRRCRCR